MNVRMRDGAQLSFDDLSYLVRTSIGSLHTWDRVVKHLMSATVDDMLGRGDLPIRVAEAFDDLGQFCQRLGQEIMLERTRRKMPLPPGPDY